MKELVGRSKALELLLSCRTINTDEAVTLGLCDKVIHDDQNKLDHTIEWLESLIKHDVSVISAMKKAVTSDKNEEDFEKERQLFAPLWAGPANRKALKENIKH